MERTHVGRLSRTSPEAVARRAVHALEAGRAEVATGPTARTMLALARVLPAAAAAAFHGWFYAPGAR